MFLVSPRGTVPFSSHWTSAVCVRAVWTVDDAFADPRLPSHEEAWPTEQITIPFFRGGRWFRKGLHHLCRACPANAQSIVGANDERVSSEGAHLKAESCRVFVVTRASLLLLLLLVRRMISSMKMMKVCRSQGGRRFQRYVRLTSRSCHHWPIVVHNSFGRHGYTP